MWGAHVEIGFLYFYQETHETENWEMNNSTSENRICFGIHPFFRLRGEEKAPDGNTVKQKWSMSDRGTNVACAHQLWINCLSAYIWICGFVIHRICAFVICGICRPCTLDRFWAAAELAKTNVAENLIEHWITKKLCFNVQENWDDTNFLLLNHKHLSIFHKSEMFFFLW